MVSLLIAHHMKAALDNPVDLGQPGRVRSIIVRPARIDDVPGIQAVEVAAAERFREIEDPRMLTPFLTRISPPSFTEDQPAADKKLKDLENNLGHCRNLLQTRDKDIDTLKSRLDSREKEVRRLRHQLESLEEIHRKYEKQKQEASTP